MTVLSLLTGRYLLGLRRRTHIAAVSAISFSAMGLGAAALVITLALLEGFQSTIRRQLTEAGIHAELRASNGGELPTGDWLATLRTRHAELEVRPVTTGAVWCQGLDGVVPASLEATDGLAGCEVNRVLAARLGIGVGSTVVVVSPRTSLTPLGPMPTRRSIEISAVTNSRPGDERAVIRVPRPLGEALTGRKGVQAVELRAKDPTAAWSVASSVQADLPMGVEVVSFRELNRPLLAALQLERVMIGFGVALVIAVAALNLLCNLALVAAEKRADVALLSAMGLESGDVRRLFLMLGIGIGALGGVLGTVLGGVVAVGLDRLQLLPLPRGVFIVSHVPFRVTPGAIAIVLSVSLLAALVASIAPARAAARRDVLAGLRYE